jgi:acyl-coenzyme A synthetase/AMP-(fatty) acid ligase
VEFKITSPAISVSYDVISGFNTGDIVNLYPKGKFRLLGRNTRFVKISGKRVDLNFVLEKIFEYLKTETSGNIKEEQLYIGEKNEKIFCIFELKFPKPSKNMKDDLKKILPGYSIPRLFISAPIPRNSMGKINKVKIEEMVKTRSGE